MPRSIIEELKRRRVIRVAGIYIAAAWVVTEVADVMFPALHLPEWTITLVVALMVLGFPIAMLLAWAFDVGRGGVRRTEVAPSMDQRSYTKAMVAFGILLAAGTALLFFLLYPGTPFAMKAVIALGILLVAAAGLLFFLLYPRSEVAASQDPREATVVAVEVESAHKPATIEDKSIAVLPFVNMSGDAENEYFSDGIAEELLSVLSKIDGLRVAARTSSFHFKGRDEKIATIGEELGVSTVLEGSVRKSGDRVRVTAQLVNVADGYQFWSESYNRELNDIFAVQDDIARSIAGTLKGTLDGEPEMPPESEPATPNVEAYQLYLKGGYLWKRRDAGSIRQSIELLKEAVSLDEAFARAYARLGAAYHKLPLYDKSAVYMTQQLAEAAAREALRLDPALGEAHAVLGSVLAGKHEFPEAEQAFRTAIETEAGEATAHHWYGVFLLATGRSVRALEEADLAHRLDPLNGPIMGTRGSAHFALGNTDAAIEDLKSAAELGWEEAAKAFLATVYLHLGDDDEAAACLRAGRFSQEQVPAGLVDCVIQANRCEQQATDRIMASVEASEISAALAFRLYAITGSDRIFDLRIAIEELTTEMIAPLWNPNAASFRQDIRFAQLMGRLKLPRLWEIHGWPDQWQRS